MLADNTVLTTYEAGRLHDPTVNHGYHLVSRGFHFENGYSGFTTNQKKSSSIEPNIYDPARSHSNLQLNPATKIGSKIKTMGAKIQNAQIW